MIEYEHVTSKTHDVTDTIQVVGGSSVTSTIRVETSEEWINIESGHALVWIASVVQRSLRLITIENSTQRPMSSYRTDARGRATANSATLIRCSFDQIDREHAFEIRSLAMRRKARVSRP